MSETDRTELSQALRRIPSGLYIVTSAFEGVHAAVLVNWVQQVSAEPPRLSVAVPRGLRMTPLIRDSRAFAVCVLCSENRYLTRRFRTELFSDEDLDSVGFETAVTGSPLLSRAVACFDCELVRHLDLEPETDLYVGEIKAVHRNRPEAQTLVVLGDDTHEIS